jgi:PAS domain S-box-containing protein
MVTLAAMGGSELLNRLLFQVPGPLTVPSVLGLAAVIYTVFRGGVGPGLLSAALVIAHNALYLPGPGQTLATPEVAMRLGLLLVSVPTMVALVGLLKRQAEAGIRSEAERRAAVAHAEVLEAANRALSQQAEELTMQTEELQSQQEELEELTDSLRETNQQLVREGDRLSAILTHALDAIVTFDAAGSILDLNPAAEQVFCDRRGRLIGQALTERLIAPGSRDVVQDVVRTLAAGCHDAAGQRLTVVGRRSDGSEFPLEMALSCIDGTGMPIFTAFLRDMTEHERAEVVRRQLEAMKQTEALKDQFLGILSHELRTPINAVTGFGSILQDGVAGPLNDDQLHYLNKMLAASDALLALVDDLLDMTRIQAGKFSITPGPMRLEDVAEAAVGTVRPMAANKRLTLSLAVPEALPELQGDDHRVGQVLLNLLSNAIKFTPPGGRITVAACVEDGGVRVEVGDTGPGIPLDEQPRLFQRFTQLDMSPTRQVGGVGLGLSICKALVEAHGGRIGVDSRPGAGSTFWFWLPTERETARA